MSRFLVVAACLLALTCAAKQKMRLVAEEPQAQASHSVPTVRFEGGYSGKKYSSSSELTSLAHSSALQAKTAVQNQKTAGVQAAFGAKTGYARAALEAASTAQVALVAKQVIVQNIERQLQDAERQLKAEEAQYRQTLQVANSAQNSASQSQQELNSVTAALASSQSAAQQAEKTAAAVANVAASQQDMVVHAKQHISQIADKLHNALAQLHETEAAAQKAAAAANIAQNNAAEAAHVVAAQSAQNQLDQQRGYHH